jgi:hypothetical protein
MEYDSGAEQPREELVPGWRLPGQSRYDYDLRIGDAERDAAMVQLREHFVAGRLTLDELTERVDGALTARTQRHIDRLLADLPRPRRATGPRRPRRAAPVSAPDPGRFLVFAFLLFAMATWILIMAWMARHAWSGPYHWPGPPGPPGGGR